MLFIRLILLLTFAAAAAIARAEVEFVGVLVTSERTLFALSEGGERTSSWRALGQDFAGYRLLAFEAKADTLVLTKGGAERRLHLKDDAKVRSARMEISGSLTTGRVEQLAITRATLVFDEENIFPLLDGFVCRITPTRRPDGNILYRASFERTGSDGQTEKIAAPSVIALPTGSFTVRIGDVAFGFSPTGP